VDTSQGRNAKNVRQVQVALLGSGAEEMIDFPNEESKLFWLAAVIDCDGCINLSKYTPKEKRTISWHPQLIIDNKNRLFLCKVQKWFGGRVYYITRKHRKNYHSLHFFQRRIRELLPEIIPYLAIKQKQAIFLIEALKILENYNGQGERMEQVYQEMKRLNAPS